MSSLIQRDIQLARQRSAQQFEPRKERWLAKIVRFNGNLRVPSRPGYVYCQQIPTDDAPPPVPVLCVAIQARENLRVWVSKNNEGEWEIEAWWRGITQQGDYNLQAYLPLHAYDHEWPDRSPHCDAVNVYQRAIVPLRASPSAAGSLNVRVEPYRYIYNGDVVLFTGNLAYDLSASQPAAGSARYVGVYLDMTTNTIGSVDGDTTVDALPIEPDTPTFPDGVRTIAMVRLDGSQTTFTEADFVDLRCLIGDADLNTVTATSEIVLTASDGWPSTTNGCAAATKNEYTANDVDMVSLDFDPDSDEYAQWTVWMPDTWDGGTITAKFCWTAASAGPSASLSPSSSESLSLSPSASESPSSSESPSNSPSSSPSPSASASPSPSASESPSSSASASPSATLSPSASPSPSASESASISPSATQSPSASGSASPSPSALPSADVVWGLQGRSYANDEAIDQAWGAAQTVTDTLTAEDVIEYTAATSAITLAGGPVAGELVQFRAYRDADAGADTLAADARLLTIKIYYARS